MSKLKSKLLFFSLLILILYSVCSCKSTYKFKKQNVKALSDNKLYKTVVDSSLVYETLFIKKFSASVNTNGKVQRFKGSVKIHKDSLMLFSIYYSMIPIMKILVSHDSIKVINQHQKEYYEGDIKTLTSKINMDLDYNTIQAIFTNSLFQIVDNNKTFTRNFKAINKTNKYMFVSDLGRKVNRRLRRDKRNKLERYSYQHFEIEPTLFRITDVLIRQYEYKRDLSITYNDFMDFSGQKFPRNLTIEGRDAKSIVKMKFKFSKMSFDTKLRFLFKSKKYKHVKL